MSDEALYICIAANNVDVSFSNLYPSFPDKCTTQPALQWIVLQVCQSFIFKAFSLDAASSILECIFSITGTLKALSASSPFLFRKSEQLEQSEQSEQ